MIIHIKERIPQMSYFYKIPKKLTASRYAVYFTPSTLTSGYQN